MNYLKKSAVCIAAMLLAANSFGVMPYNPIELPAITANAADIVDSGECGAEGDNVKWQLDSEGTLTISGEGKMQDWQDTKKSPWYNSKIKKIVIDDGVTSIGIYAFNCCAALTSITIPNSVTSIGECAFRLCESLAAITIPESVTCIGTGAFYGCRSLTSIKISDSVTRIDEKAFSETAWLEEKRSENPLVVVNGIVIDGILCEGDVTIPDSVTNIADEAFYGCSNLTSIILPDSVTSIGELAFVGCDSLVTVTIPDSVKSIGGNAFNVTPWLEEKRKENPLVVVNGIVIDGISCEDDVVIPDSVISIGDYAFSFSNLKSIEIPNSVTSIGDWSFYQCSNLESIIIPDSVTSIGDLAFSYCGNLNTIKIGKGVTNIGYQAFRLCSKLKSITIPDNITSIEVYAFEYCDSLESIIIENPECEVYDNESTISDTAEIHGYANSTAQAYAEKYNRTFVALEEKPAVEIVDSGECGAEGDNLTWTFDSEGTLTISGEGEMADAPDFGQHDITKVVVENGVTSIGGYAFSGRENVTSIIIPDSVVSIGAGAFEYCNLTSVTIPDSVTSIGGRAFSDTPWIAAKQKENPLVIENGILIDGTTCEGEVVIPDSVTSIGEDAFRWHENVTSIIIPDSVTSIGDYAFSQCIGLTSITIPDSVTSIGECAFQNTPWLEEKRKENPFVIVNGILISATCEGDVVIPDSVTSIGDFAFGYCRNLTSVIIPDSVTSIGDIAFECCSNLNSITIPDSVTSIGQGAFKWCQSLVSVTLPNNITCIEDYTFSACEKLTSITIPSNVTTIGGSAFGGCNITSITLPDKVSNIGTWAFWLCEALNSITINNPECEIYDEDTTIANGYNDEVYFNGTIYGYAGSTAQAYAEKYNRKFVALEEKPTAVELGDVNGDDSVDSSDASLVLAEYARIQTGGAGEFTESQLKAADVNNDDVVDSSDASKILAYYAMISTGKEPEWD